MFITPAVMGFINSFPKRITEINYLPKSFYDTELSFDKRIRPYLVRYDHEYLDPVTKKNKLYVDKDWIGIAFNRGVLQTNQNIQPRTLEAIIKNIPNLNANLYDIKLSTVEINVSIYSNSLLYLENYEENLLFEYDKNIIESVYLPLTVDTSVIPNVRQKVLTEVSYSDINISNIEKEDRDDKGTIASLSLSANANFLVTRLKTKNIPLIGLQGSSLTTPNINTQIFFEIDYY